MQNGRNRKGKGYSPIATVERAIAVVEKLGWSPEEFFERAEVFMNNKVHIDVAAAVKEFNKLKEGITDGITHMISATARAFAEWVLITDVATVQRRFKNCRT